MFVQHLIMVEDKMVLYLSGLSDDFRFRIGIGWISRQMDVDGPSFDGDDTDWNPSESSSSGNDALSPRGHDLIERASVKEAGLKVVVVIVALAGQQPARIVRLVLPRRVGHVSVDGIVQVLQNRNAGPTTLRHVAQPRVKTHHAIKVLTKAMDHFLLYISFLSKLSLFSLFHP